MTPVTPGSIPPENTENHRPHQGNHLRGGVSVESRYGIARIFWDRVFEARSDYDPASPIQSEAIEAGLDWLCQPDPAVLDFGCGTGRLLARCLVKGARHVTGIDISEKAVKLAETEMASHGYEGKSRFIRGGVSALFDLAEDEYEGVALFGILDSLLPDDARLVISEVHRILPHRGRVLLRLNPYLSRSSMEEEETYTRLDRDLYQDGNGIYLWNISEELLQELVGDKLRILSRETVAFPEAPDAGRLYRMERI